MSKKYALQKVRTFQGMECQGFNAELTANGKPVAFVIDEGNGGSYLVRWYDNTAPSVETSIRNYLDAVVKIKATPEEADFCKVVFMRAKEPACDLFPDGHHLTIDEFLGRLFDDFMMEKQFRSKTKCIFADGGKVYEVRLQGRAAVDVFQAVKQRRPKAVLLNGLGIDELKKVLPMLA